MYGNNNSKRRKRPLILERMGGHRKSLRNENDIKTVYFYMKFSKKFKVKREMSFTMFECLDTVEQILTVGG